MEIYKYKAPPLLFVTIKKAGEKSEHLTLVGETKEVAQSILKKFVSERGLDPFAEGRRTTVEIRDYIDGKNGAMVSFNFKGLSPRVVYEVFVNRLKK